MANIELLDKVLDYIKTHPQEWRQSSWYAILTPDGTLLTDDDMVDEPCGTAFCFAGHAAMMTGFPKPPSHNGDIWTGVIDGREYFVDSWAERVLDLTDDQADILFQSGNTLDDLETIVNAIKENPEIDYDGILVALDRTYGCSCCKDEDDEDYW